MAFDLNTSTVLSRRRCASAAHIVFISNANLASAVMRGSLPTSVYEQTRSTHGAKVTLCSAPCNFTKLDVHFARHGEPSICIMIKYADPPTHRFCRGRGALVVLDNVDNHRAFDDRTVKTEAYQSVDAIIVQTRAHAEWLVQVARLHAIVLPHPHGNLQGWGASLPEAIQDRKLGLGVLLGDAWRNRPPMEDTYALNAASCALNFTLHTVYSPPGRPVIYRQLPCPNVTHGNRLLREAWMRERRKNESRPFWLRTEDPTRALSNARAVCNNRRGRPAAAIWFDASRATNKASTSTLCAPPPASLLGAEVANVLNTPYGEKRWPRSAWIHDRTSQRTYYDTPELHTQIDIGLLWRPATDGHTVRHSQPPAHADELMVVAGVPTIGWPMVAYVEGVARRLSSGATLNLTRTIDLPPILCALAVTETRKCLRSAALRAAALTSPQYSTAEPRRLVPARTCSSRKRLRANVDGTASKETVSKPLSR